jgi:hypothetical protein
VEGANTTSPAVTARGTTIVGGVLLAIAAVAGGSLFVIGRRRQRRACRECRAAIDDSGDLCATCRHAAAEILRRAASERMEQVRADEVARRRRMQLDAEEKQQQQALREEEARAREAHEAQCREDSARRECEEEACRESRRAAVTEAEREVEQEFDPYSVLGVQHDSTPDDVRAAYEQARSKYDLATVTHLGIDVQEHFREKALAVDRAYHMIAG